MSKKVVFDFSAEKSEKLKAERGISFEQLIALLDEAHILDIVQHPNQERYPDQKIFVVNIGGYAHLVPHVARGDTVFLKTIIPSRKATEEYLNPKGVNNGHKTKK